MSDEPYKCTNVQKKNPNTKPATLSPTCSLIPNVAQARRNNCLLHNLQVHLRGSD